MPPPNLVTFASCPPFDVADAADDGAAAAPPASESWYLLGQIKTNMTLTKPTLIAVDHAGEDFALTFDDAGTDLSGFRRGWTAAVPGARREAARTQGGKGFVRVPEGEAPAVRLIPGKVGRVVELLLERGGGGGGDGRGGEGRAGRGGSGGGAAGCGGGCGRTEDQAGGALRRCTGCGAVSYCGKECQAKAWAGGHKADCKMLRVLGEIWPL